MEVTWPVWPWKTTRLSPNSVLCGRWQGYTVCQTSAEADETERERVWVWHLCPGHKSCPWTETIPQAASLERLVAGSYSARWTQRSRMLLHSACWAHICVLQFMAHSTWLPHPSAFVMFYVAAWVMKSAQLINKVKFRWKHKKNKNLICFSCSIESTVLESLWGFRFSDFFFFYLCLLCFICNWSFTQWSTLCSCGIINAKHNGLDCAISLFLCKQAWNREKETAMRGKWTEA